MSNKLNLRVLHDVDLSLLRENCQQRKIYAQEFYDSLGVGARAPVSLSTLAAGILFLLL